MEDGYAAVVERLSQDRRICVTTHESPDGDALGSLLGAGLALRGAGYDVAFYLSGSDAYPAEYRFLPVEEIERQPPADAAERVLYAFDCGSARRIGPDEGLLERFAGVVNVDHHHDNTRFGDVNLVDPQAACTAQIIARLLHALRIEVPKAASEALYVGLVTDTGRFQYANTTPDALRLAAELVEDGVQPAKVFGEIWESVPFAKQRLLGTALSRAQLECDGRLLVTWLERKDFDQAGAPDAFSEGLIDQLRAVQGVDVAALIREPAGPGGPRHKVSLRSRTGGVDVSSIARQQGGGGHKEAAGFSSEAGVEEIVAFLRRAVDRSHHS
jgi:phosphoesterase RecJ-like protein